MNDCTWCNRGYKPNADRTQCVVCPAGTYDRNSVDATCTPCDSGRYCPSAVRPQLLFGRLYLG